MLMFKYSDRLYENNGIYFSEKRTEVSYPEEGNKDFFEIEENSFWFNHRNNCILEVVKRNNEKQELFDVGGGNGFVSKKLQENQIQVILVEPGLTGCINAQKRGISNIVCATLEDAQFYKNSISSVGLFDVIEHVEDDVAFLKSIHETLKDDGLIYITVPAYKTLWSSDDVHAGHYRRYTLKELEQKLNLAEFKIVESTYFFTALPIPIFLFRTIPSWMGFNKKKKIIVNHENDHKKKSGLISSLLNIFWKKEVNKIRQQKTISFGSSCLVVGKKK